ncbi:MAG: response regulator [Balneolaceae bacterium]|nr:MAG: response regulator [Balneolaceae bacterium]
MDRKIAVLMIEDSAEDAELVEMTLKSGNLQALIERVDSPQELEKALAAGKWDVVISDYNLPGFDGLRALEMVRNSGTDLPFIIISGKVGEETAVAAVLAGAHDYVMKDNMKRLPTVVEREIRNAQIREAGRRAEHAQEESEHLFRLIFENSHEGILLTDGDGTILAANKPACSVLKCDIGDLLNANRQKVFTLDGPEGAFIESRIQKGQFKGELILTRKDGTTFPAEVSAINFTDKNGNARSTLFFRDITGRKNNEQKLRSSLKEKDVLLAEIHHRVKNNLAIISGLLELQSNNIENQQIKDLLSESIHRIKAIALLHEKVYNSDDLARINLGEYLKEFIGTLRNYYLSNGEKINVFIEIPETYISLSSAIPIGLIVNELITNAFRHAFTGRDTGNVRVSLDHVIDKYLLKIIDDGIGMPDDVITGKSKKLGMTLVYGMIHQLKADIEINRNNGTAVAITFNAVPVK